MIKILKSEANLLEMEILDEDKHTIPNLIIKYLLNDKRVEYAGYRIPHPLVSYPRIIVRTKEKYKPIDVLKDIIQKILKDLNEFEGVFKRVLE